MLCEMCKERIATVHLTEIVNKQKKELHLCEECAKEQGFSVKSPHFSPAELLGELVSEGRPQRDALPEITCPDCGMSFSEFRSSGRLGCPSDYSAFRDALVPLLTRMHGQTQHIGAFPARAGKRLEIEKQLQLLRQKLQRSVQREEYEQAAELRDRIVEMEEALGG